MSAGMSPVMDRHGQVMFRCSDCAEPIVQADIVALGMRLPDPAESAADYLDAELIDAFRHERCIAAAKAS